MFNFIDWRNLFFQHLLRALSAKNANHLQTTDTIKRHQRYSIHYHCGWPSLGIWGSATHYGLPALPEPFLRACGLRRVCTGFAQGSKKIKAAESFLRACGLRRVCTRLKKIKAAESFLRACGLRRVCTRLKKNQNSRAVLWSSVWFYVFNFIGWCN